MKDNGIVSERINVPEIHPSISKRMIGARKLVHLAINALKANDPPEIRCRIAIQLLRSIKKLNKFGILPHQDQELLIRVRLVCGEWHHCRWIDYYRGCVNGTLIPLRSESGKLLSELPAQLLRGVIQAVYSKQIGEVQHAWNDRYAGSKAGDQETVSALRGWEDLLA